MHHVTSSSASAKEPLRECWWVFRKPIGLPSSPNRSSMWRCNAQSNSLGLRLSQIWAIERRDERQTGVETLESLVRPAGPKYPHRVARGGLHPWTHLVEHLSGRFEIEKRVDQQPSRGRRSDRNCCNPRSRGGLTRQGSRCPGRADLSYDPVMSHFPSISISNRRHTDFFRSVGPNLSPPNHSAPRSRYYRSHPLAAADQSAPRVGTSQD